MSPIIIIGTGLAGYSVASEYRKLDANREILLISGDDGCQYSKPLLSNAMAQNKTADQLTRTTAEEMGRRLNVTVLTHQQILSINTQSKRVKTSTDEFNFGELVLALGADPVIFPLQGDGAKDVLTVNDLNDYSRLRLALNGATRVLIMGAGLIGCEFANDLLYGGISSIVVDPHVSPLASLVPEPVGQVLRQSLEVAGIGWKLGTTVERVERMNSGYAVTLLNGDMVEVDVVISAIGLRPRIELAKNAGIATRKGILIDGYGQTCIPGIYALGDCAEYAEGRLMPFIRPTLIAARSIAATLAGSLTRIDFPAMAIMVKTPAHPVIVLPAQEKVAGSWSLEPYGDESHWLFKDVNQRLQGFVVSGVGAKAHVGLTRLVGSHYPVKTA
ncbi:MAG: FAD-dependent oxidoreductase [Pseudomonas sp.]